MTISAKTRKALWAKSGNRCAICRCILVIEASEADDAAVVGDECHIIGRKPKGPRGRFDSKVSLDTYDNLILLCKTHHKLIDDQPIKFTVAHLKSKKLAHEQWVRDTLEEPSKPEKQEKQEKQPSSNGYSILMIIQTGKDLMAILRNAHALQFENDELESEEEVELVGGFLQQLQDEIDIPSDFDVGQVIRTEFDLNADIQTLKHAGWKIFGRREKRKSKDSTDEAFIWDIAIISILRNTNPGIINITDLIKEPERIFSDVE